MCQLPAEQGRMTGIRVFVLALLSALAFAGTASAATATLKGQVVGTPYLADSARTAVPVLFSKESAKRARLKSPLGVAVVPRRTPIATKSGSVLPGRLRVGDRFTAKAKISRSAKEAVYPTLSLSTLNVTKRATQLSTAELEEVIKQAQKDIKSLGGTVTSLATSTKTALGLLTGRVDGLTTGLTALTSDLTLVKSSVTGLTSALETAKTNLLAGIDKVRSDLQPQITEVADGVTALVTQLGDCNTANSVLGRICGIEALLGGLDTGQVTNLTTRVNNVTNILTDLIGTLTGQTLADLPAALTGTLATALNALGGLQTTVAGLTSNLGTVSGTVGTLQTTVGGITSQLTGVNLSTLQTTLGNLVTGLGAGPTGLNLTAITGLQSSLSSATGQIATINSLLGGVNVGTLQSTVSGISTSLSGVTTKLNGVCSALSGATAPVYSLITLLLSGNATLPTIAAC